MSLNHVVIPFFDDEKALVCNLEFTYGGGGVIIDLTEGIVTVVRWRIPNSPPGFFERFEGDKTAQDTLLRFSLLARNAALRSVRYKNNLNRKRRQTEFIARLNHLSLADAMELMVETIKEGGL